MEATFRHQHLIGAPWTQYLWDIATAEHVERGGRRDDDLAVAQALAELLERAGRGPDEASAPLVPDGWGPALPAATSRVFDPYGQGPADSSAPGGVPDLDDAGMYTLPGPADLSRRALDGDPLFLSPAATSAGASWSPQAVASFKDTYFDDLPPLEDEAADGATDRHPSGPPVTADDVLRPIEGFKED